jgi:hypothetical protein
MAGSEAGEGMRRRDFIKMIGSTVGWPLAACAQTGIVEPQNAKTRLTEQEKRDLVEYLTSL